MTRKFFHLNYSTNHCVPVIIITNRYANFRPLNCITDHTVVLNNYLIASQTISSRSHKNGDPLDFQFEKSTLLLSFLFFFFLLKNCPFQQELKFKSYQRNHSKINLSNISQIFASIPFKR